MRQKATWRWHFSLKWLMQHLSSEEVKFSIVATQKVNSRFFPKISCSGLWRGGWWQRQQCILTSCRQVWAAAQNHAVCYIYQYYRYLQVPSVTKNVLTQSSQLIWLFKNFFSIEIGTTLFGGGGRVRGGMVDFFPFEVESGKCPLGNCFSSSFYNQI